MAEPIETREGRRRIRAGRAGIGGALCALATGVALTLASAPTAADRPSPEPKRGGDARDPNLCLDPEIRRRRDLLCPDLRMRAPYALSRTTVNGTPVLRAANSVNSVGDGPAEVFGRRSGEFTMSARQRIRKRGHGRMIRTTNADLYFKSIPGQGRYWKYRDAAKFTLYLLNGRGERIRHVETGPKQIYCLRDLEHTRPGLVRSPGNRVYPACSQDFSRRRVALGTSVGWSDIYPSTYHENWIELNDIPERGCYAFAHTADPSNGIYELNERNNQSSTVVFLTPGGDYKPGRCRGVRDKALPAGRTADDTQVSSQDPPYPYKARPGAAG